MNAPPPAFITSNDRPIMVKASHGVTLLGQEKGAIKESMDQGEESKMRKFKNGAVVIIHGKTFEPDVSNL